MNLDLWFIVSREYPTIAGAWLCVGIVIGAAGMLGLVELSYRVQERNA